MELSADCKAIWLRILIVILIISAVCTSLYLIFNFLLVFVVVIGLSALLQRPIQVIEDHLNVNRTLAVTICLVTLFLITSVSFSLILFYLIDIFDSIIIQFPIYLQVVIEHFKIWINDFIQNTLFNLEFLFGRLDYDLTGNLIKLLDSLYQFVITASHRLANHFIPFISDMIIQAIELTSTTIIVMILTILLSKDWQIYQRKFSSWIPAKIIHKGQQFLQHFISMSWGYLKAQLIVTSVTVVVLIIGFYLVKIDGAFTLGIAFGLVDFIPIIGVGLLLWPWIIYCLVTGQFVIAIELSIIYLIIVGLRQFLEPKLVSEQIGVSALFVISIGYLCFLIFGLLGILLTPVMLITIQSIKCSQLDLLIFNYIRYGKQLY